MAKDLNRLSQLPVREAEEGDKPVTGNVLIAPAGWHCSFSKNGAIRLTDDPPLWGVRPAADASLASAGTVFGSRTIGVVLTGMGRDGTHGLSVIKAKGGRTFAEAESSCVVYGMPKEAMESGAAEKSVDLKYMPETIMAAAKLLSEI
jgi:two-component system chemotaxis response regulator CheB